jgi:cytochrome P450
MIAPGKAEGPGASPPGPRGYRLLGSLLEVRRDRLNFVLRAMRRYGDLVCFRMGVKRLYLVSHPNHARHILCDNKGNYCKGLGLAEARPLLGEGLLTSEGAIWANQRRRLQPAFQGEHLTAWAACTVEGVRRLLGEWRASAGPSEPLDVAQEMGRLTIRVLGEALFRTDFRGKEDFLLSDFALLGRWAMSRMTALLPIPPCVPTPQNWRARRALQRLKREVKEMVGRARTVGAGPLLGLLTDSCGWDGGTATTERQVHDEVMTFLLAGHETTAATLTWTWYLLARYPAVEDRLHEELAGALGDRDPTPSDLPRLAYARMLVQEVMRLYPPVWMISRKAIGDDQIDGYTIRAGSDVLVSAYSIHRHPSFWRDPERFDPERFDADLAAGRAACSYLAFGAGPRSCVGAAAGLLEAVLAVAAIAQRCRLELAPGVGDVEPEACLTLKPRNGLGMRVVWRQ